MRHTLLLGAFVFLVACTPETPADMVVYGKIWTGNPLHGYAEAMAIQGDTIIAVGSRNEMVNYEGEHTEIISAPDGGLIVPGFIDTHTFCRWWLPAFFRSVARCKDSTRIYQSH